MVMVVLTTYAHHFHTNRTKSYKTNEVYKPTHLQHYGTRARSLPHTHCTYFHSQSRAHQFTDCTKLVAMEVNCHQQQHLTK